jgi:hypothetical protein
MRPPDTQVDKMNSRRPASGSPSPLLLPTAFHDLPRGKINVNTMRSFQRAPLASGDSTK